MRRDGVYDIDFNLNKENKIKAIINCNIYDFNSYKENQYIIFDETIREIGCMEEFKYRDNLEIYDVKNNLIIPGLVNCHSHIYSAFARGLQVPFAPKNFQDILDQLWWKLDSKLDEEATYYSAMIFGMDCIRNGVTTLIDHHASGQIIRGSLNSLESAICRDLNLKGIFCFETSDRFNIDECIEENVSYSTLKNSNSARLFGLHASMSLSSDTLKKVSELSKEMPVHMHIAESMDDVKDCKRKYNSSIIERLNKYGLIRKNSLLAHCIHINSTEAEIIKENCGVIVVNPTSNMNNAVGFPNMKLFMEKDIPVIIGNDGLGANITREYLNIVFGSKLKLNSPIAYGIEELRKSIIYGYKYTSKILKKNIGKIESGYSSDFIAIPYNYGTTISKDNILGHIFFGVFDNFTPKDVWSNGIQLLRDYELNFNYREIYKEACKVSKKIWFAVGGD